MDEQAKGTNKLLKIESVDAFMDSIGDVQIQQLDADGKVLEIWWLQEAFPAEINFGKLDYSSTDLVEISITWTYKSVKVQMMAHGAEEEFTYFQNYVPPPRPGAGGGNTCADLWRKSGTTVALDVWQRGLASDHDCYLDSEITGSVP
jgi:hypothetical protein